MLRAYLHTKYCSCCNKRLYSTDKSIRSISDFELLRKLNNIRFETTKTINQYDFVRGRCRTKAYINKNNLALNQINDNQEG